MGDAEGLPAGVLADAERTHPCLVRGHEVRTSPVYDGPTLPIGCDDPLPAPPPGAACARFELEDLFRIRALVAARAVGAGLNGHRVSDLVLAVNELASNAIRHGHGRGTLHVWGLPGELICQVQDDGHITDPLAGRRVPAPNVAGGLGLWTVNQRCDLVEVRSGLAGTTVRVHTSLN